MTWVTFGPTWDTTGSAPDIGNGIYVCKGRRYEDVSSVLAALGLTKPGDAQFRLKIVIGSTTDVGSGSWRFEVPFARGGRRFNRSAFYGTAYDVSAGQVHRVRVQSTTSWIELLGVTAMTPFTWATGDRLVIGCKLDPVAMTFQS